MSVQDLDMQDDVTIDLHRLGRYRVADYLPDGIPLGYLARTHRGVRVVAPYDTGPGADQISGHLVGQVRLDQTGRYQKAVIRWG